MNLLLHDLAAAIERDASLDLPGPWTVARDTLVGADQVAEDEVATVVTVDVHEAQLGALKLTDD